MAAANASAGAGGGAPEVTALGLRTYMNSPEGAIVRCHEMLQSIAYRLHFVRGRGGRTLVRTLWTKLWSEDEGQDIAEYAVMLAVILVIVVGTVRLIGGNSNNVFSSVASSIGS